LQPSRADIELPSGTFFSSLFKGILSRNEYFFGRLIIINNTGIFYTVHALIVFTIFFSRGKAAILALKMLTGSRL
jgi:hypothetical protein